MELLATPSKVRVQFPREIIKIYGNLIIFAFITSFSNQLRDNIDMELSYMYTYPLKRYIINTKLYFFLSIICLPRF